MDKTRRFNIVFIGSCVVAAILACIATAWTMIRVIGWYLSNCDASTQGSCLAAEWLISYWWLIFVPGVLLATFLLRRVYDRLLTGVSSQD